MVTIRPATERDIKQIVSIHMRAFEGFFLTLMGRGFLDELYRNFIIEEDGMCIVAEARNHVAGFAAGALRPVRFFRKLRKKRWHIFLLKSLGGMFRRPFRVTRKLIGARSYGGDQPPSHEEAALLSSIAVDPDFSGEGIGQSLLDAFCEKIRNTGIDYVYLTTDRDDNERTIRLYERFGFELESTFTQPGKRVMNRYLLKVESTQGPADKK